jgi:hypothetical protein
MTFSRDLKTRLTTALAEPAAAEELELAVVTENTGVYWIRQKSDFPNSISGIITLEDEMTYNIIGTIDLLGDRLVCGENTVILGTSSENSRLKSTGLTSALITSNYSLPIRNITIEADLALDLNGDSTTTALDWTGVNFTDCAIIGNISNYTNVIFQDCAFLNSGGLTLDGTIGTFGASSCLFNCNSGNTVFILPSTLTITRRVRIVYSSFVVISGETGMNVNVSATIPTEMFILDSVNFSGGGTYLVGVTYTSNTALFVNCVGITNTSASGQLTMQSNATATTVLSTNTFYKIAGTTTAAAANIKFNHANNRLTYTGVIPRRFHISTVLSFTSGNNNVCEFGFYDSVLGSVQTNSKVKTTANTAGRAENITLITVLDMVQNEYIEIHCANTTATNNITVEDLNFVILEV